MSYRMENGRVYFPKKDVPGEAVYPAFRPEAYTRSYFQISRPKPSQGPDAFLITYYGKAVKGREVYMDLAQKFRQDGFKVEVEESVLREGDVPSYESHVAWFEKEGIFGSFIVTDFYDPQCQEWSIIQYVFHLPKRSGPA